LQVAISAITSRQKIAFKYLSEELIEQDRKIAPYAVTSRYGHWYLYGLDLETLGIRSFRLDRVSGDIAPEGKPGSFEVEKEFNLSNLSKSADEVRTAVIYLRVGRALALRSRSKPSSTQSAIAGWDLVELNFRDQERFIEEVLWYGDDAIVMEPKGVREEIVKTLELGVKRYG
jgi:predicted DNA-binding transcriptional regulator YafY